MVSPKKIPSSLRSCAPLPRECLEGKAAGWQNGKAAVLLGCNTVCCCWNQKTFQLSNNRYDFIQFNASQLFRFGVWLLSRKHSFQWKFWDHCWSCERQRNRCTQGVLLFTWPTALAWETIHVLWLHGLDCGSVAFNVLSKLHQVVCNSFPDVPMLTAKSSC